MKMGQWPMSHSFACKNQDFDGSFEILMDHLEIKANSMNLYPPTKGNLRETCKSQNINPIYLTLSSPTVSFRS